MLTHFCIRENVLFVFLFNGVSMKINYFSFIVLMFTLSSFDTVFGAKAPSSDDEESGYFTRQTLDNRCGSARQFGAKAAIFTEEETLLAQTIAVGLLQELNPDDHSKAKGLSEYYMSIAAALPSDEHQISYNQPTGSGRVTIQFTRYPACDSVQIRRLSEVDEEDLEEEADDQWAAMKRKQMRHPKQWMLPSSDGKKLFYIDIEIVNWSGLTSLDFFNHPVFEEIGVAQLLANLVTTIKISGCSIATFDPHAFAIFNNLEHLDISHNRISRLSTQTGDCPLPKLRSLNLKANIIKRVGTFFRQKFDSLRTLILADNQIMQLSASSFSGLARLRHLSLNGNFIDSIVKTAFDGIGSNTPDSSVYLDLGNNFLTTFPPIVSLQDRLQLNVYHSFIPESAARSSSKFRIYHAAPPSPKKVASSPQPATINLFDPTQVQAIVNEETGETAYEELPAKWLPIQGSRSTTFELQAATKYPSYRDQNGQLWVYQERTNEEGEDVSGYHKAADTGSDDGVFDTATTKDPFSPTGKNPGGFPFSPAAKNHGDFLCS